MTDEVSEFMARCAAAEPKVEAADIEGFGRVYLRRQSGEDQWRLLTVQSELASKGRDRVPVAAYVAVVLLKSDGSPMFDDLEAGFQTLSRMDSTVLGRLYEHALRVTGLGERAVEDAEKKSSSSQGSEPGMNSPS